MTLLELELPLPLELPLRDLLLSELVEVRLLELDPETFPCGCAIPELELEVVVLIVVVVPLELWECVEPL